MRKSVVVLDTGILPELNNINGPITFPTRVDIKKIAQMVKNGRKVYECDPKDPKNANNRVLLTDVSMVTADNFGSAKPVKTENKPTSIKEEKKEEKKEENKDTIVVNDGLKLNDNVTVNETAPVEEKKEAIVNTEPFNKKYNKHKGKKN